LIESLLNAAANASSAVVGFWPIWHRNSSASIAAVNPASNYPPQRAELAGAAEELSASVCEGDPASVAKPRGANGRQRADETTPHCAASPRRRTDRLGVKLITTLRRNHLLAPDATIECGA